MIGKIKTFDPMIADRVPRDVVDAAVLVSAYLAQQPGMASICGLVLKYRAGDAVADARETLSVATATLRALDHQLENLG